MKYKRRLEIRTFAENLVERLELKTPIDVEGLVRDLGGEIQRGVKYEDADTFIVKTGPKKFRIGVPKEKEPRVRFSIAHELGHLFLHLGYLVRPRVWEGIADYRDSVRFRRGYSEDEKEADEFAGSLLMPSPEFRRLVEENRSGDKIRVSYIAEHFLVSQEAVMTRGRWLGIFEWD